ncbi:MAG TPA: hypothetical protein VL404_01600 [Candidatus Eisenbacteria bacterium]|jgi:hypothetical protein|nr:hypothetical protein [Candidatus Eisenbacteria bacterium]
MKKITVFVLTACVGLALAQAGFADTAIGNRDAQRDASMYRQQTTPSTPIWKNRDFWRNEKERSGLPQFWDGTKSFFQRLNPMPWLHQQRDRYETRKTYDASSKPAARNTATAY